MSTAASDYATFVVRLSRADGRLANVVERVRTGAKARFRELETLGELIAGMLASDEQPGPRPTSPNMQGGHDS